MCRSIKRAFTLVELLVCIAVVAVLASILFPVFGGAMRCSRKNSCLYNLKQIGVAFALYTNDYDGKMPTMWDGIAGLTPRVSLNWGAAIYPYVKSKAVYRCPDDPNTDTAISYNATELVERKVVDSLPVISSQLLIMDGTTFPGWVSDPRNKSTVGGLNSDYTIYNSVKRAEGHERKLPRHDDSANLLFVDGHVHIARGLVQWHSAASLDALAALRAAIPFRTYVNPDGALRGDPTNPMDPWQNWQDD